MKVQKLSCRDFRNMRHTVLEPCGEMNVIHGENAQGKTNLLEAVWLFTGAKSFRSGKDAALIRFGCEKAVCELDFLSGGIENEAVLEIGEHRKASLNQNGCKSPSQLAGQFHAVVFSPNDLSLVKDGPAVRRRFLDTAIGQLYPSYIDIIKKYARAVAQRNKIIREYRYDASLSVMLDVFEEEIAQNGEKMIAYRKRYLAVLDRFLPTVYSGLSSGRETLTTEYRTNAAQQLQEQLAKARREDMLSGITSVGPHRDELEFQINDISARGYGSQGQKRSVALAVKLAEAEVLHEISGEYPIFLLDDVMSELDPERQNYVLNHIQGMQSFLTCCDPSQIRQLKKGKKFYVKNGEIR